MDVDRRGLLRGAGGVGLGLALVGTGSAAAEAAPSQKARYAAGRPTAALVRCFSPSGFTAPTDAVRIS